MLPVLFSSLPGEATKQWIQHSGWHVGVALETFAVIIISIIILIMKSFSGNWSLLKNPEECKWVQPF